MRKPRKKNQRISTSDSLLSVVSSRTDDVSSTRRDDNGTVTTISRNSDSVRNVEGVDVKTFHGPHVGLQYVSRSWILRDFNSLLQLTLQPSFRCRNLANTGIFCLSVNPALFHPYLRLGTALDRSNANYYAVFIRSHYMFTNYTPVTVE